MGRQELHPAGLHDMLVPGPPRRDRRGGRPRPPGLRGGTVLGENTLWYCAPLEGVTGYAFRRAHARYFTPADKYFAPFFSPTQEHVFPPRVLRELSPENNAGFELAPQLLCRSAEDFVWAANALFDMGYGEVNLNLGCPSGTVTAKGKGAGFLGRTEELDRFFEQIFSAVRGRVSVKTRLGLERPEEFTRILAVYNRYPICELTVHPRVRSDMYKLPVRREWFDYARRESRIPLCFNGDIFSAGLARELAGAYPELGAAMLGRGLAADPAMIGRLRGRKWRSGGALRGAIREFHGEVYDTCAQDFGSAKSAMLRMKELWSYLRFSFAGCGRELKRLMKSRSPEEYASAAEALIGGCALAAEPEYGREGERK